MDVQAMWFCLMFTWRSSSMTSSMVITPTASSLDGKSGKGPFSMSRMQYEQPLCRLLKVGVAGGTFLVCWASFDSNLFRKFWPAAVTPLSTENSTRQLVKFSSETDQVTKQLRAIKPSCTGNKLYLITKAIAEEEQWNWLVILSCWNGNQIQRQQTRNIQRGKFLFASTRWQLSGINMVTDHIGSSTLLSRSLEQCISYEFQGWNLATTTRGTWYCYLKQFRIKVAASISPFWDDFSGCPLGFLQLSLKSSPSFFSFRSLYTTAMWLCPFWNSFRISYKGMSSETLFDE